MIDHEEQTKTCDECRASDSTSPSPRPNLGLWVCEDCDKTLCSVCKTTHANKSEGDEEENKETGEAKKHLVRPVQLRGKSYDRDQYRYRCAN